MRDFNTNDHTSSKIFLFYLLILFILCILSSCGPTAEEYAKREQSGDTVVTTTSNFDSDMKFKIIMIGNCEYINGWCTHNEGRVLVHKGDCKNQIHYK